MAEGHTAGTDRAARRVHGDTISEATRYLCAGVYLDDGFAERVLRELFGQTFRAVAPSYGFDVGLVAAHCLAARRQRRIRDVALLVLFLQLAAATWSVFAAAFAALSLTAAIHLVVRLFLLGAAGWIVLSATVLCHLVARRQTVARDLHWSTFRSRPRSEVPLSRRLRARLDAITWGQLGNVTVYSAVEPFVGAGEALERDWSFAIRLIAAPEHDGAVERFSLADLVAHFRRRFEGIAEAEDAVRPSRHPLAGLSVSDHVFVSAGAIHTDPRFLPDRTAAPRTRLSPDEVQRILRDPHGPVRHSCSLCVSSWQGEVVTSTFFTFSSEGEKLHFECARRVLRPIRWEYHEVDTMTPLPTPGELGSLVARAAAEVVPTVATAPFRLVADLVFDHRGDRPPPHLPVDHGARLSVREMGAERGFRVTSRFHNYFQLRDARRHIRVVERHAFEAIFEFLDENGIDTSELSRHLTSITMHYNNTFNQTGDSNVIGAVNTAPGGQATQSGSIDVGDAGRTANRMG
jgi:hypothetical protein